MIKVALEPFDPYTALAGFQASGAGALASFVGLARDEAGGVTQLVLEHYPGFTEKTLLAFEAQARSRFDLLDVLVIHRAGAIAPGEPIVLAAALARHRKAAIAAVDFLMDHLKTDAPFWKLEEGPSGARWIEPRADDHAARAAWEP